MTKHKRDQRGSSSSSGTSPTELKKVKMSEEAVEISSLKDLIQNLTETMESNFGKLHEELSAIRQEMKHEIDSVKENVKSVEKKCRRTMGNCGRSEGRDKGSQRHQKGTGTGGGRTAFAVNEDQSRTQRREGKDHRT